MSNLSPKSAEILESNVGKEDGKMNKNIVALNLTIKSLANLN
jgi:hypothetical protein